MTCFVSMFLFSSVMLETVTSVQKVDGENRIAQAIFLLSKCSGLNAYIPLTLNIDLSHQLCTQVLYGVTVRAISGTQMASDFGFATAQADELSAQPAVSTSELNDADPPDLEEWGDVHNPDMDYVGVSTSELNDVDPPDLEEWGDMQSTDTDYAAWCSSSFSDELGTGNTADSFDCTTDHCHTDESKGLGNPRRLFVNNIPFRVCLFNSFMNRVVNFPCYSITHFGTAWHYLDWNFLFTHMFQYSIFFIYIYLYNHHFLMNMVHDSITIMLSNIFSK